MLANPQLMQQLMGMAQSLGSPPPPKPEPAMPDFDLSMVQKLASLAGNTGTDGHQRALLAALKPYLSAQRIQKLEKAMRAAKLAKLATGLLADRR